MSRMTRRQMTVAELDKSCAKRSWERWVEDAGCVVAPLAGLVVAFAPWWRYAAPVTDRLWAGGLWFVLTLLIFMGVAHLRTWPYRREIHRRYGEGGFADCMLACARTMEADEQIDYIVVLMGTALPHGGAVEISLEIGRAGDCRLVATSAAATHLAKDKWKTIEKTLQLSDADPIPELIRQDPMPHFRNLDHFIRDGFQFNLGILRRHPAQAVRAHGNLVCVPQKFQNEPTFVVATHLLALADAAGAPPRAVGWCDPDGNIGIGPI